MVRKRDEVLGLAKKLAEEANKVFFVKKAYLYGSYAYGKPGKWSDIDVAIVSPDFQYIPEDMAMKMLFRLAATVDPHIGPIPLTEEEVDTPVLGTVGVDINKKGILVFELN